MTPPSSPRAPDSDPKQPGRFIPDVLKGVGHRDEHGNLIEEYHSCGCRQVPDPRDEEQHDSRNTAAEWREWHETVSSPRAGRSTVSAAGEPRTDHTTRYLYQCPGCWSYGLWSIPIGGGRSKTDEGWIECECGERMFRIDLRNQEPSPYAEAAESRPSVTERQVQAAEWHRYLHAEGILVEDEGEECGSWHHRVFLAASPAGPEAPGIRNRLLASRFDPSVSLDELIGAGPEAVPQSERFEFDEKTCSRCHGPNLMCWHAPSPLWNAVMRDADGRDEFGVVCPRCFGEMAKESGVAQFFCLTTHNPQVELATTFGDGRVWDADKCLWVEAGAVPQSEREGLTPEAVKKAIRLVTDNDSYDLGYVKECARLANDVLAALASPAHPDEE